MAVSTSGRSGVTCAPELDAADALGVAHSMRTLVRGRKLPPGTAEIYDRVASQIIAAAHLSLTQARK
jgi:hypothetical protein